MQIIANHDRRAEALRDSLMINASEHVRDFFPAPDQPNRLPDFQAHYQAILAALEAGNFETERKKSLLNSIDSQLETKVPAAQNIGTGLSRIDARFILIGSDRHARSHSELASRALQSFQGEG